MAPFQAQVILQSTTALPRDNAVNVYHFTGTGGNDDGLAQAMVDAYVNNLVNNQGPLGGINKITCKVYEGNAAPPNPPLATKSSGALSVGGPGPREVALCLSQKGSPDLSGRPPGLLKTERGRTYIGPFETGSMSSERPSAFVQGKLLNLASAIKDITTTYPGYVWCAGSDFVVVSEVFVDNEWDTQRRRGLRPTSRLTRAL